VLGSQWLQARRCPNAGMVKVPWGGPLPKLARWDRVPGMGTGAGRGEAFTGRHPQERGRGRGGGGRGEEEERRGALLERSRSLLTSAAASALEVLQGPARNAPQMLLSSRYEHALAVGSATRRGATRASRGRGRGGATPEVDGMPAKGWSPGWSPWQPSSGAVRMAPRGKRREGRGGEGPSWQGPERGETVGGRHSDRTRGRSASER